MVGIDRRNNVPRGVSSLPSVFKLLVSLIRIFIAADRSTLPSLSFLPRTRTIKSFAVKINDDRDVPVSLFVSICYRHWRAFAIAYTRFLYILRLLFSLPFLFFFFCFAPPLSSLASKIYAQEYTRCVIYSCADCTHYGAAWRVSESITSRIRTWFYGWCVYRVLVVSLWLNKDTFKHCCDKSSLNTWKIFVCLRLLARVIFMRSAVRSHFFHINLDDSFSTSYGYL